MGRHKAPFPMQSAFKKLELIFPPDLLAGVTLREITTHCGVTRGVIKQWKKLELVEKVLPAAYPTRWTLTKKGWDIIEESNANSAA